MGNENIPTSPIEKQYNYCPTYRESLSRKQIENRKYLSCQKCGFIFWNNPKPATNVVILKDGKILLLKRATEPYKGYWCLPGGYIDYGETPEEAVIRETKEEAGLDIKIHGLVGVYMTDDPRCISIDVSFHGEVTSGEVKLSDESSDFAFFSPEKISENIAFKDREAILDFKNNIMKNTSGQNHVEKD
jgi:ADP-ribose pyrophosphatase YjhB (NUDIX family)